MNLPDLKLNKVTVNNKEYRIIEQPEVSKSSDNICRAAAVDQDDEKFFIEWKINRSILADAALTTVEWQEPLYVYRRSEDI